MKRLVSVLLGACACLFPVGLLLADVVNVASRGTASTSQPLFGTQTINQLIDGSTANLVHADAAPASPLEYSIALGADYDIKEIRIYPRQDGCCPERLTRIRVSIHKDDGNGGVGAEVWGMDLFTDGTNPGSAAGGVVNVPVTGTGLAKSRHVKIASLSPAPIPDYSLQIADVAILADVTPAEVNRALATAAKSNKPLYSNGSASVLVDGNRGNIVHGEMSIEPPFFYTINMGTPVKVKEIVIWARQDICCPERLSNYRVSLHNDNAGAIGAEVFQAVLHGDGSNPGSDPGSKDVLSAELSAAGNPAGQWLKIEALESPLHEYALQIADVEVFGEASGAASILISQQPANTAGGVGQTVQFSVAATAVNGDASNLGYQWRRNGTAIEGATNAIYTTPPLVVEDDKVAFTCAVSYPGLADVISDPAVLRVNLAYHATASSNRPLWANGGWNISMITDGNRTATLHGDTAIEAGMAYEVDLGAGVKFEEIDIYPRQDGCCPERLANFQVSVHTNNAGAIGNAVWSADLYTDDTNPGSTAGSIVKITADLDPAGKFEGQWIRILALSDPIPDYHLQMTEIEAYGAYLSSVPKLEIQTQPADAPGAPGRTANLSLVARVLNGNPANIGYQWFRDGTSIPGATAASYTTPPLVDQDTNAVFHCVVSFPGVASIQSTNAKVFFDYNYSRGQPAYSNRPLWGPGNWNISMLVDGNTNNVFHADTQPGAGFAYDVDLGTEVAIEHIDIYPRQDGCCPERLANFRVSVHDSSNGVIGNQNWAGDLFTDDSNAGSGEGVVVSIEASAGTGTFKGSWVRVLALADPVPDYFLQMTELEVFGKATSAPRPMLGFARSANGLTLSWTATGFLLQETGTPGQPASWVNVAGGGTSPVTVPTSGTQKYYRLRSQ